jgi:hypothetical protein
MGIEVCWYDESTKTIGWLKFGEIWSWDDFRQAVHQLRVMAEPLAHPIDVIADLRESRPLAEFDGMVHLRWLMRTCPEDKRTRVVLVTGDPVFRSLTSIIRRLFPAHASRYFIVDTLEEAAALLSERPGA